METFVVRVWTDGDASAAPGGHPSDHRTPDRDELRGILRHVATGTEHRFATVGELVGLLRDTARPAAGEATQ